MNAIIPKEQIVEAVQNWYLYDAFEIVLLDVKLLTDEIITICKYDEGHVILQIISKGVLKYKILLNEVFLQLNEDVILNDR